MTEHNPGTCPEVKALEKDMKFIKRFVMAIEAFLLTALFGVGVWVGNIDSRVEVNKKAIEVQQTQMIRFEDKIEASLIRIENKLDKLKDNQ